MFVQIAHFDRLFHIRGPVTAALLCPIVFFDIVTLRSVVSHAAGKARVGAWHTTTQLRQSGAKP